MNFKEFDSNKFISNMPAHEEESEANFSKLNTMNNIYHLYFSRTQEKEENQKSYLLVHCSMKIDEDLYFDPDKISVYLSQRAIKYDLSNEKYLLNDYIKINEKINIDDLIPKVFRINIPANEKNLSYVFYTNIQIQTIYEDSMKERDHVNEEIRKLYAISYKNINNNKVLYIKLFGAKQEINFRIESTNSEISYLNSQLRPSKILSQQHLNCGNSFYYIGSYSVLAEEFLFRKNLWKI